MEKLHFSLMRNPLFFSPVWKLNVELSGQMNCFCNCKIKYY